MISRYISWIASLKEFQSMASVSWTRVISCVTNIDNIGDPTILAIYSRWINSWREVLQTWLCHISWDRTEMTEFCSTTTSLHVVHPSSICLHYFIAIDLIFLINILSPKYPWTNSQMSHLGLLVHTHGPIAKWPVWGYWSIPMDQ